MVKCGTTINECNYNFFKAVFYGSQTLLSAICWINRWFWTKLTPLVGPFSLV